MSVLVQCPKCSASVSVATQQTGQRVKCPSCGQAFFAPASLGSGGPLGGGRGTPDEDDWLTLDEELSLAPSPATSGAGPDGGESGNAAGLEPHARSAPEAGGRTAGESHAEQRQADGEFMLPPLGDDANPARQSEDVFADLPPMHAPEASDWEPDTTDWEAELPTAAAAPQPAQAAEPLGPEESFRVTCPICGTVTYARVKQVGKRIKCSDCYSEITVPRPPKPKKKPQFTAEAETFKLSEPASPARERDPFRRSADELLREAEREPEEEHRRSMDDLPDVAGWVKSVLGIFLDPGVIVHFGGLSLLLAVPAALTIAYPVFAIAAVPLALLGITLTVSCGFAIMIGVSNQHDQIEDWPTADPAGWFEPLFLVVVATAIAVGPAYVAATLLGAPVVITIGLVMFCVYAAFPVVVLSMLDLQSVTSPFSPDVAKSITRCQEDWGAFYFSAAGLFGGLYAYFLFFANSPLSIALGVVLSIGVMFVYFALLGRLALAIGEVVEIPALDQEAGGQENTGAS